jgi:hypothetical protein
LLFSLKIAWAIALLSIDSAQWSIGIKNPTTQTPRRIEPLKQLTHYLSFLENGYFIASPHPAKRRSPLAAITAAD